MSGRNSGLIIVLVIGVITALAISVLTFQNGEESIKAMSMDDASGSASILSNSIYLHYDRYSTLFDNSLEDTETVSILNSGNYEAAGNRLMAGLAPAGFDHVYIYDPDGNMLWSSSGSPDTGYISHTYDFSDRKATERDMLPTYIRPDGNVITTYAGKTMMSDGKPIGIFAQANTSKTLNSLTENLTNHGLYAVIIDESGKTIHHPNNTNVISQRQFKDMDEGRQRVITDLRNGKGDETSYVNLSGAKVLCAYMPVDNLKWGVIVVKPESNLSNALAMYVESNLVNAIIMVFCICIVTITILTIKDQVKINENRIKREDGWNDIPEPDENFENARDNR